MYRQLISVIGLLLLYIVLLLLCIALSLLLLFDSVLPLWWIKMNIKRDETWRVATCSSRRARQARYARHDKRDSHDTCSGAQTEVDMSTSLISRSCFWDWCKSRAQKTKLVHASTTAFSSSAMLEQAQLGTTRTTRRTYRRVETWRDVTSQVEFWLKTA